MQFPFTHLSIIIALLGTNLLPTITAAESRFQKKIPRGKVAPILLKHRAPLEQLSIDYGRLATCKDKSVSFFFGTKYPLFTPSLPLPPLVTSNTFYISCSFDSRFFLGGSSLTRCPENIFSFPLKIGLLPLASLRLVQDKDFWRDGKILL